VPLHNAYATGSEYLMAALGRLVSPLADQHTGPQCDQAVAAYRRLDDAYRQLLAERGARRVSLPAATGLVDVASAAGDAAGMRRALRLLWADEDLDEEHVLQGELACWYPVT